MKISYWITLAIMAIKLQQANSKIAELEEQKQSVLDKALEAVKKINTLDVPAMPIQQTEANKPV